MNEARNVVLITDLLTSPLALLIGRFCLGCSMFLLSYAMLSKSIITIFNSTVGRLLSILISIYAFQVPFSPSLSIGFIPVIWEITGILNLLVLIFSLALVEFTSGYGLNVFQNQRRHLGLLLSVVALWVLVQFLHPLSKVFQNDLGDFFPIVFNVTWLIDLIITIFGMSNSVFKIMKGIIASIVGIGDLSTTITIVFAILSILVIPQMIPYGDLIPKVAMVLGIIVSYTHVF
jgi:hypothetical protein